MTNLMIEKMPNPEGFRETYFDELTVSVRNVALHRSVGVSATDVTDVITGTAVLGTHLALIGKDYPCRKRAQGIDLTLHPYEDSDQLQQEWARERQFYCESVTTRKWDIQFSDLMQKLLTEGRTAAVAFDDDPPTAGIYYRPEHNLGPPVIPESWGIYCRITRSVLSALADDIRSGLPISLEVIVRLNPFLKSHDYESLGLLPYSDNEFTSLGWLQGLDWTVKSRRSRVPTNRGYGDDVPAAGEIN